MDKRSKSRAHLGSKHRTSLRFFLILFTLAAPALAEHYDLYLLAGQSNMDGRGAANDLPAERQAESDKAIIYYRNLIGGTDGWKKLAPGYSFAPKKGNSLPSKTFGPEIGFAEEMLKNSPNTPLALVKGSRGGTNIQIDWNPGKAGDPQSQGPHYRTLLGTFKLATDALETDNHTFTLKGILWHQGESNRKMSSENYQSRLEELIDRFRQDLNAPDLPIVIGEVYDNGQRDKTRAAIQATATASKTVALVTSEGTTTSDPGTHFDTKSLLLIGRRYAKQIQKLTK